MILGRIKLRLLAKWLFYCVIIFNACVSYANPEDTSMWFSQNNARGVILNVDLFISSVCPHCYKADAFFHEIENSTPWIKVRRHVINDDKMALQLFYQKLKQFDSSDFSAPTIIFCNSRWVGFENSETTGKGLLHALNYCHQQIEQDGALTQRTINIVRQWSGTSKVDAKLVINQPTSPLERIVITALVEAFTPCSLFCFCVFLAFLWMYPERRWVQFFLSAVFLLALGIVHTAQFVFTEQYQHVLSQLPWYFWSAIGALILFVAFQYAKAKWSSGVQRSVLWFLPVLVLSVITVYARQQVCAFSVGAVFQQWIQTQPLTQAAYYFYQFTYLCFYLLPLTLLLGFYLAFGVHPRRILPVSGCLMLMITGLVMLIYPDGLASSGLSAIVLIVSLFLGWYYVSRQDKKLL